MCVSKRLEGSDSTFQATINRVIFAVGVSARFTDLSVDVGRKGLKKI